MLASVEGSTLPASWQMGTTDWHAAGHAVDQPDSFGLSNCTDPWVNANVGPGFAHVTFFGGTNRAWIRSDLARDTPLPLAQGVHYSSQVHAIENAKTTAASICSGCVVPVSLVLTNANRLWQVGAPRDDVVNLTNPVTRLAYIT